MANRSTKKRDLTTLYRGKVDALRQGEKNPMSDSDILVEFQKYLKISLRDAFNNCTASSVPIVATYEKPLIEMSNSHKSVYEINQLNAYMFGQYCHEDSTALHRGHNYHLYFNDGKMYVIKAGKNYFTKIEDLAVAKMVGETVNNDSDLPESKRNEAFEEYNTLKAQLS